MYKSLLNFLKHKAYLLGFFAAINFFVLALLYQKQLPHLLSSLFLISKQLSSEELVLDEKVKKIENNIFELKKYIESSDYDSDLKTKRVEKFNTFSSNNTQLINEALETNFAVKVSVHNTVVKYSAQTAEVLDVIKNIIIKNPPLNLKARSIEIKKIEPLFVLDHKLMFQDQLNESSIDPQSIFLMLSLLLFLTSVFHLLYIQNKTKKKNIYLNSQLDTFKKAMSNMSEGVIVTDKYGFFTFCNESARQIIGPVVNDIFHASSVEVIGFYNTRGERLRKDELPMQLALKKATVNDQEIFVKNAIQKEGLFVSCSNGYFVDTHGVTAGSVVVLKNITAQKQIEIYWKSERERAVENSKLKSDFLASMSHEIRTPMNGILGLTTLLKDTILNHEQRDYVLTIQRSAKSLLMLINDILDHSKIEAGKLDIINKPFNLKLLVQDVVDNFKPAVLEKNIALNLDLEKLSHDDYNSDQQRLRQILMNLVGNAIKFTAAGQVKVQVETMLNEVDPLKNNIKFTIHDTGPGMAEKDVQNLFQKYFQTQAGQNVGGTGLGLSICKQLVGLLNGKIGVTSQLGQGSQFWFEVPLEISEEVLINEHEHLDYENQLFKAQFTGLVLVAEDNTVNQKVIQNYLHKLGLQSVLAQNGKEAVKLFNDKKPDLVILDSNMPVMNGREAAKEISSQLKKTNTNQKFPLVNLSADVRQVNSIENLEAGITDFLSKPLDLESLVDLLRKYLPEKSNNLICTPSDLVKNKQTLNQSLSHFDKIKNLRVGDNLLVEELFNDFKVQGEAGLLLMEKLFSEENFIELGQSAHSLKSAAAELDALVLASILQLIEDLTSEKKILNFDEKNTLFDNIKKFQIEYPKSILEIENKIKNLKKQQLNKQQGSAA